LLVVFLNFYLNELFVNYVMDGNVLLIYLIS